jgi:hypothetical protein
MVQDENAPNEQPGERPDVRTLLEEVQRHQAPDWTLGILVRMLNNLEEVEIGVTLLLHGQVVTGLAVSGRQFFQGIVETVRPDQGEEETKAVVRNGIAELFGSIRDGYPTYRPEHESEPEDDEGEGEDPVIEKTTYLHLKSARVFLADGLAPTDTGLWLRVRLSSVDGWAIGTLTVS